MKRIILGAFLALSSLVCVILSLTYFDADNEPLMAVLAVLFGFTTLTFIMWGIDDTKIAEWLSEMFAGEEDDDE